MELLGSLFVGRPVRCAAVAALFVVLYLGRRASTGPARASRWPLAAAAGWVAYAAWEWLILVFTPEANIRVDLLLIGPALAILSVFAVYRALRPTHR